MLSNSVISETPTLEKLLWNKLKSNTKYTTVYKGSIQITLWTNPSFTEAVYYLALQENLKFVFK